jgi:hypothetical protein
MRGKRSALRCKGLTNAGKPCRAAATAGGLCFFHANPNKAAELGRKGGRSNRHSAAESLGPLPRLDTAKAVQDTVAQLVAAVFAGDLEASVAKALVPLLNLLLRAIDSTDLERLMVEMEKQLAEAKRAAGSRGEGDGG